MRGRKTLVLVLAVVLATCWTERATAQNRTSSNLERFQLFSFCLPMALIVEELSDGAAEIELTEERIQTMAESRLRAARLFTSTTSADTYLYVRVTVVGGAFSMNLAFNKRVSDSLSGESFRAATWNSDSTGTHGRNADYILQGLSERLDRFVLEYLRVNEAACG